MTPDVADKLLSIALSCQTLGNFKTVEIDYLRQLLPEKFYGFVVTGVVRGQLLDVNDMSLMLQPLTFTQALHSLPSRRLHLRSIVIFEENEQQVLLIIPEIAETFATSVQQHTSLTTLRSQRTGPAYLPHMYIARYITFPSLLIEHWRAYGF